MAQLTEWLKLMVSEIDRKRDDAQRAKAEEETRRKEAPPRPQPARKPRPSRT